MHQCVITLMGALIIPVAGVVVYKDDSLFLGESALVIPQYGDCGIFGTIIPYKQIQRRPGLCHNTVQHRGQILFPVIGGSD